MDRTIDTTPDPESPRKKTLIRPATVLADILTLGALGGGTALAVHLSTDTDPDQNAAPAWEIPGAGEQIPVGLPEGFTGPSDWSVTSTATPQSTGLDDGGILTANSDGILSIRDPETAEPVWAGTGAPAGSLRDPREHLDRPAGPRLLVAATSTSGPSKRPPPVKP